MNWGLHDLKKGVGGNKEDVEGYAERLGKLIAYCQKTGASLSIATTTPVPCPINMAVSRNIEAYNRVIKVLAAHKSRSSCWLPLQAHGQLKPFDVHFKPEANRLLGIEVAIGVAEIYGLNAAIEEMSKRRDVVRKGDATALTPVLNE